MPIEWAVKDNYAPKEMGSNKQRIRRRRNPSPCSYYAVEKGRILWYNIENAMEALRWRCNVNLMLRKCCDAILVEIRG